MIGCAMIAFGLLAWLGETLSGSAGFAAQAAPSLAASLWGVPGLLLGGGVALLLWGFTEKDARRD
ncbi:MAG TPA: hypothetical protein DEF51_09815 [Myxococcales bacterium]|nr:hypothetical protein [Myxococcales bacterium]